MSMHPLLPRLVPLLLVTSLACNDESSSTNSDRDALSDARAPELDGDVDADDGSVENEPPDVTFDACRAMGGTVVLDPGDGRTYRDGCGDAGELIGHLVSPGCESLCGEGGICCRP